MAFTTSTAAVLKATLLIAVWVVLIHSSRGQQAPAPAPSPSPPLVGCSNCSSICAQSCQKEADDRYRACQAYDPAVAYKGCFEDCLNSTCQGKTCAAHVASCTYGTVCDPQHCGTPCVQDCCVSCNSQVYNYPFINCKGGAYEIQLCEYGCTDGCKRYYGCASN